MSLQQTILLKKIIKVPSLFFRRSSNLTLPLARVKGRRLVLQSLDLFRRSDVEIEFFCFFKLYAFVKKGCHLDAPPLGLGFYFIFITHTHGLCGLGSKPIEFHFTGIAGDRCKRSCFKQPGGPKVFIQPQLFFFRHDGIASKIKPGFLAFGKKLMEIRDRLDAFIKILNIVLFVR